MMETINIAKKSNKNRILKKIWLDRVSYLFCAPYIILFCTFTVLPVLISVIFSFTDFNMLQVPKFVFFDNYITLLMSDNVFLIAVKNTLILAVITGPVSYLLCLLFAWFINELNPKIRAFVTLCFYAPSISGNAYLIWALLFNGDSYGYVNGRLLKMGIIDSPILFFSDSRYMMVLVVVVVLWLSLGTSLLVFIAGFQGVDRTYYEAAAVDGIRNRWQELWYVTLPMMKPQLMFSAIMSITAAFGIGDVITGLVGFPSTNYAVHTIMNHLYDYGNVRFEMGYASAIATILFCIMLLANKLVQRFLLTVGE
jgi:multiple sugar transport system permease protein